MSHQIVIDIGALHTIQDIEQEDTVSKRRILETADTGSAAALLDHIVGPGYHVAVCDFALAHALGEVAEGVDNVTAHELPDHAESESALTIGDVSALDADKGEAVLLAEFDGVVCVFDGLESHEFVAVCGALVRVSPIDGSGNDFVVGLEENGSVAEVVEEGYNGRLNVQGVEPQSENTCFPLTLGVKVFNVSLLFLGDWVKTRMLVEEVGNKGEIELGVTSNERMRAEEFAAAQLVSVVQNLLCSLVEIMSL